MKEKGEKPKGRRLGEKMMERRKVERAVWAGGRRDWRTVGRRL